MSEPKFTKGEWVADRGIVFCSDFVIADCIPDAAGFPKHKVSVYEIGEINAQLISAAPNLLEACEKALIQLELMLQYSHPVEEAIEQLEKAIKKANSKK